MTRLFIRFYLGVLLVLFLAWYIDIWVTDYRRAADERHVVVTAHAGGARLIAAALQAVPPEQRSQTLHQLQRQFDYQLSLLEWNAISDQLQSELDSPRAVGFQKQGDEISLFVRVGSRHVVQMGAFPNYFPEQVEAALAGWMRLAKQRLTATPGNERDQPLAELRSQFEVPIEIIPRTDLPEEFAQRVIESPDDAVFFSRNKQRWFAAMALDADSEVVQVGPFHGFENTQSKIAATTLALVLVPAGLAIALLLRPVERQFRHLEHAALAIADGDLAARVDERRVKAAQPLAQAFNQMAAHTESMVKAQRELLQAVSHELRTPLARMRFAINLIETAETDAERQHRLESLDASTEELNQLVEELLSYVRMETTGPQRHPEAVRIQEAIETILPKFQSIYPDIEFQVSPVGPPTNSEVWADRKGFLRALGNLISNAGKHAQQRVVISAHGQNGQTTIDVDDDGPGIAVPDRQRVFEPFVRVGDSEQGGVGLGLALVQRITNRNAGTVRVDQSPMGGCRIRTTWPSSSDGIEPDSGTDEFVG